MGQNIGEKLTYIAYSGIVLVSMNDGEKPMKAYKYLALALVKK